MTGLRDIKPHRRSHDVGRHEGLAEGPEATQCGDFLLTRRQCTLA